MLFIPMSYNDYKIKKGIIFYALTLFIFQKSDNGPVHSYASVVSEVTSSHNLQAAEKLGTDLAVHMLGDGADAILEATKKQMAAEIAKEKAERAAKKAASDENGQQS